MQTIGEEKVVKTHTSKHHFCAWNVFLRVKQVFEKGLFAPTDGLVFVGISVSEPTKYQKYQNYKVYQALFFKTKFEISP